MFKKIGIIGAGVMGEVFINQLVNKLNYDINNITACGPEPERLKELDKKYKIKVSLDNKDGMLDKDLIILSVKPQQAKEVLAGIALYVKNQVFLSIMAGVSLNTIKKILKTKQIVRCMPNTPAQIGFGMTVWIAGDLDKKYKQEIKKIISVMGEELEVDAEKYIDAATAVSGSGPAYVFDLASNLISAAINLGFNKKDAKQLVAQTIVGAGNLLKSSSDDAGVLRKKVTSKGGTTEAAFKVIDKYHIDKVYKQAIKSAFKRAVVLSK